MKQNNNQSMATVVETFYVEETINLVHDNDALSKWNDRVEELKLTGQKSVVKDEKSPIPFLWMNEAIIATFEILCPTKVPINDYDKTPIPVELLDVVALCVNEKYFDSIMIWYNEKQKDPVIVGYLLPEKNKNESTAWAREYYSKKYLIGRWADVKASMDALISRAKEIFFHNETIRLKKEIRDRSRELEDLESTIANKFGGAMPETVMPF